MTNDNLKNIQELVDECVKTNKLDFLAKLISNLQKNYEELALLSTDGNYSQKWSHQKVLDYVTYETP